MLTSVKARAHVLVALSILLMTLLALGGIIGEAHQPERIEQLQVVISGSGESGVKITETIDQDFGSASKHGPELVVPNDFGVPTDVTASSPDAPDGIAEVAPAPYDSPVQGTRIRVGDPDVTVTGQHRYTISYVLPAARFAAPDFAIDAVGAYSDMPIENVTVVFDGIELSDPKCTMGSALSDDPCDIGEDPPHRVEVDRLDEHEGITVSGDVAQWQAGDGVDAPPLPTRRTDQRAMMAAIVAILGTVTAAAVYQWSSRKGGNEVVGMSPAEAAHGTSSLGAPSTRLVSDAELAEMTTIEFAPPKGIEPWQGQVVVTEVLDQSTVSAWFSGLVAHDVLHIENRDGDPRLSLADGAADVDPVTLKVLDKMFGNREVVDLDGYDAKFAGAWSDVAEQQEKWVKASGWWRHRPPTRGRIKAGGCLTFFVLALLVVPVALLSGVLLAFLGSYGGWATAVAFGIGIPFLVARVAYSSLLPGRTANGSAYALQVASFRRFLLESEGQYVEWAWKNNLLREYSAWAVALDAAEAWQEAMQRAGVPQPEIDASSSPLLVHSMNQRFVTSTMAPSTSSGGSSGSSFSSGGFSGSVGGGGGGGSHGSW